MRDLRTLSPVDRREALARLVRSALRSFVGLRPDEVLTADQGFIELGFDSLRAVDFKAQLEDALGTPLRSTVLYDCPTVGALVDFLTRELAVEDADSPSEARPEGGGGGAPVAVVGMACRFPGAPDLASYWHVQRDGVDCISDMPRGRWNVDRWFDPDRRAMGKMYVREGGFVDDITLFDADFFRITPREARALDPQQRLLLELCWRAFEHAAIAPDAVRGASVGVFVGMRESEYYSAILRGDRRFADLYMGTGNAMSAAAGRVSFCLGLTGPALAVDTACSSSLVAVHAAMQSLRRGECTMALAAGVNVLLDPVSYVALCKGGMLSPDARCKAFAAGANGYVRSEGAGVLLLEPLAAARAANHRVHGVLLGSAINQDGSSGGLTVPYGPAQEAVLRGAVADAGIDPEQVSYVEAHGTGTALGDPIELQAIDQVYGAPWVGTVKTNLGHLETAAGVAGLIRTVQALHHGVIPRVLHFDEPSPHIPWDELDLRVAKAEVPWTGPDRVAGVSSFGFSGTNAHVLVGAGDGPEDPAPDVHLEPADGPFLLFVSASSEVALGRQLEAYAAYVAALPAEGTALRDACYTARVGRAAMAHRIAVLARDRDDLVSRLKAAAAGTVMPGIHRGRGDRDVPPIGFLFTGQGAQYAGMGRDLDEAVPAFSAALDEAAAALDPFLDVPLRALLWGPCADQLSDTAVAQPALFALAYALTRTWGALGVSPSQVLGHSVGEIAAGVAAGVFGLADAARLVATRGQLMRAACPPGAMVTAFGAEDQVWAVVAHTGVSLSGVNGPRQVTLSGTPAAVGDAQAALAAAGISARKIVASRAFHSPHMDAIIDPLLQVAQGLRFRAPEVGFVSTADGVSGAGAVAGPDYWARQVRAPVRFDGALRRLLERSTVCLELGPRPVLCTLGRQIVESADGAGPPPLFLPSMRTGRGGVAQLLEVAAALWVRGVPVVGEALPGQGQRRTDLPGAAFLPKRHWCDLAPGDAPGGEHPLLGARVRSPRLAPGSVEHTSTLDASSWLGDHVARRRVMFPAAGFLELMLASMDPGGSGGVELRGVRLLAPLLLESEPRCVHTSCADGDVTISSQGEVDDGWTVHATGTATRTTVSPSVVDLAALRDRIHTVVQIEGAYARLRERGLQYGPAFRGLVGLWRGDGEALGQLRLPDAAGGADGYNIHPSLLDAAFQACVGALDDDAMRLPVGVDGVVLHRSPGASAWCHVQRRSTGASARFDVVVFGDDGRVALDVEGLELLGAGAARPAVASITARLTWNPAPLDTAEKTPGPIWVLPDQAGFGAGLLDVLSAAGVPVQDARTPAGPPPRAVVVTLPLDGDLDRSVAPVSEAVALPPKTEGVAALILRCLSARMDGARLYVVTRGAVDGAHPTHRALWGALAAVGAELPGLQPTALDVDPRGDGRGDAIAQVAAEVLADSPEQRVCWRGGERRVARIVRGGGPRFPWLPRPELGPWQLRTTEYGQLEHLGLVSLERRSPGPAEVEVALTASALNFRDVLHAMGLLAEYAVAYGVQEAAQQPFGFDAVGEVVGVGPGVSGVSPGDRVMLFGVGTCASHITLPAAWVARAPGWLSDAHAAALPTVGLTALYGLARLAALSSGEHVLIHAATGGVGQAALAVARRVGAVVHATASPSKHGVLRAMGVQHIYNSRDTAFADQVLEATGGRGVDVVLNSLTEDRIHAGFRALAPGGRFVEIGKLGILTPAEAEDLRPDVRYLPFDLGQVARAQPDVVADLFETLVAWIDDRSLALPGVVVYPMEEAIGAFSLLAQARHVGKVVLTHTTRAIIRPDRCYLITGGLGALGLIAAEALVSSGARRLVLAGRTAPSEAALAALTRLREAGGEVEVVAADVSSSADVDRLVARCGPMLGGVVHAAGVVDDRPLSALDKASLTAVLGPKLHGLVELRRATRRASLDFFVSFSSISGVLGSAGQVAYAAANAAMDGLAAADRRVGRPHLSVAWGPWSQQGMAARLDPRWRARIRGRGIGALSPEAGAQAFIDLLAGSLAAAELLVAPMDWRRLLEQPGGEATLYDRLRVAPKASAPAPMDPDLLPRLAEADPGDRPGLIAAVLCTELARVIGLSSPDEVDRGRKLTTMGVDSLLAIDLRSRLEAVMDQKLPASMVFDHPTIDALALFLARRFEGPADPSPRPAAGDARDSRAADPAPPEDLHELSDEELVRRLADAIDEIEPDSGR